MNNKISTSSEPVIEIKDLSTCLGGQWVHRGLNLTINRGEIIGIVGGSGTGKTTLLREMLYLEKPAKGTICLFGKDLKEYSLSEMVALRHRWGMLFQQGALFSALTVLENTAFPLHEFTNLSKEEIKQIALLKIRFAGLPIEAAAKYPAELSGGMLKRAALARAIAMDPELLFLDEPTAGLDPLSAAALDELLLHLHAALGLTIVLVTHDLDTLWKVVQRVVFLGEGKLLATGTMTEMSQNQHPLIYDYFHNPRARAAIPEEEKAYLDSMPESKE